MDSFAQKVCGSCGQKGPDLPKCTACTQSAWYCNVQCQRKDWKTHKYNSNVPSKAEEGQDEPAEIKEGQSSSSTPGCDSCGKAKLLKCGDCKLVKYCGTDCQRRDWGNHSRNCSILKVYPEGGSEREINANGSCIIDTVTVPKNWKEDIENSVGVDVDMIVKIETSLVEEPGSLLDNSSFIMQDLCVHNESKDYNVYIKTSDKNYAILSEKILKDGLEGVVVHPLLKKLYLKAHLNPDFSLDVYLNCIYNIQNW